LRICFGILEKNKNQNTMTNKIRLTTLEYGILEVEPNEIELFIEDFYENTTQPYSKVLLKPRGDEEFDNNRAFKVYQSKADIENSIRQVQKRNLFSIIKVNPNYNYDK
jgi:predicted esterase YcpF (UPF0227 family)